MGQSTTTVTLIRHGVTPWSSIGRFAGRTDLALTAEGEQEVAEKAAAFTGAHYDEVRASPLLRATRTAELLGFGGCPTDADLRERDYGEFEGLTTKEIRARVPGWDVWTDEVPGGEPLADFVARVDRVVERYRSREDEHILLIGHAHWIRLFTARWLRLEPAGARLFRASTLGITRVGWEREYPVMLAWNA